MNLFFQFIWFILLSLLFTSVILGVVKIGGPWDPVHERGSMDLVHILLDPVHGPVVYVLYFPIHCNLSTKIIYATHIPQIRHVIVIPMTIQNYNMRLF